MKALLISLMLLFPLVAFAATIYLEWDDPNPPGTVLHYRIYRQVGTSWTELTRTTNLTAAVKSLPAGTNILAVTAMGLEAESDMTFKGVWIPHAVSNLTFIVIQK